jgi:hypothetical protein
MSVMLNFMVFSHRCKLMLVCLVDLSVLAVVVIVGRLEVKI